MMRLRYIPRFMLGLAGLLGLFIFAAGKPTPTPTPFLPMTIQWTPTVGDAYRVYELLTAKTLLGGTPTGEFSPSPISGGMHHYVVTSNNSDGESLDSNILAYKP